MNNLGRGYNGNYDRKEQRNYYRPDNITDKHWVLKCKIF